MAALNLAAWQLGVCLVKRVGLTFWTVSALRSAAIALCVLAPLLTSQQALSQTISSTVYFPDDVPPGSGAGTSLTLSPIYVRASVRGRCGFSGGQTLNWVLNQPDFDVRGFKGSFTFTLDCTGPANVGVMSLNGGLLQNVRLPSGYRNKAPYDVGLQLTGDGGAQVSASCEAASLIAGSRSCTLAYGGTGGTQTNFTGPATIGQGLTLNASSTSGAMSTLVVQAKAYTGSDVLVSGAYQDVLSVTVNAAI